MKQLPNITLIAMASVDVEATVRALQYSCRDIEFGAVKLVSHYLPDDLPDSILYASTDRTKDIDEWSRKVIYELPQHIDTDYALLIHADGFVINPNMWRDEFLDYDYIGAPWPLPQDDFSYRDINGVIQRVGNSVSLRSKKLLNLANEQNIPWQSFHGYWNEDGFICVNNRHIYEANGCRFAPLEVAKYFSHEIPILEIEGIKPFVFHKWYGSNKDYPKF